MFDAVSAVHPSTPVTAVVPHVPSVHTPEASTTIAYRVRLSIHRNPISVPCYSFCLYVIITEQFSSNIGWGRGTGCCPLPFLPSPHPLLSLTQAPVAAAAIADETAVQYFMLDDKR